MSENLTATEHFVLFVSNAQGFQNESATPTEKFATGVNTALMTVEGISHYSSALEKLVPGLGIVALSASLNNDVYLLQTKNEMSLSEKFGLLSDIFATVEQVAIATAAVSAGIALAPELAAASLGFATIALAIDLGPSAIDFVNNKLSSVFSHLDSNLRGQTTQALLDQYKGLTPDLNLPKTQYDFVLDNMSLAEKISLGQNFSLSDSELSKYGISSKDALDVVLELNPAYKNKSLYEIDQIGTGLIKIGQEHELFIGTVSPTGDWSLTGNMRDQLITSQGDSMYTKVSLAAVGTAQDIAAKRQQAIDYMMNKKYEDGSNMYEIRHNEVHADKQSYLLFAQVEPKKKHQQYDPLAIDLDNSGKVETVGLSAGVLFDHDADGVKTGTGWVAAGDGLVVRDLREANELFKLYA
jgi:hypothetical protein